MNILLTGGSGFIGRHFHNVKNIKRIVTRNNDEGEVYNREAFYIDDLNGETSWVGAFENIDVVVHLAGLAHSKELNAECYQRVNVDGALRLANEAAKEGVRRFVFVSSIGVNGSNTYNEPFVIDSIPAPDNDYARSKLSAEEGLKQISRKTGLEVVIVRPTLVYGPMAPGSFGMLTKLISKLPILPFGLASNRRNFISVQNLVDLLIACAEHPEAAGHTFLASDGETVSTKEFANQIANGLGKKVYHFPMPVCFMRLVGKLIGRQSMVEQIFGNLEVDSSHSRDILGWTPPFTMKQAMKTLRDSGKPNDSYN